MVIPHLYNGRRAHLLLRLLERLQQNQEASGIASTLTPAERNGDFSAIGTVNPDGTCAASSVLCLVDPSTGRLLPQQHHPRRRARHPAAQVAKKLAAYMSLPNQPGQQNGTVNNILAYYPNSLRITQTLDRVDENIGEHVRLFFRYHWQDITNVSGSIFPPTPPSAPPTPATTPPATPT